MIVHLQIEEEKKKEEEEGEKKEKEKHDLDDPVYEYKKIKNISHQWMEIQPSSSKIIEDVSLCVTNGLESLLSFERWSRHDEMTAYVNVLEEWDDTVCGDWESPESNQL
jgi:dynein heavy chain